MPSFQKAAIFGDIHFGLRNNSKTHNENCSKFIDWFIDQAKRNGAETCIFLGDWHHFRSHINITTLNYSLDNLEKLDKAFEKVYFLIGNHDLYYKNKRDINSVAFGRYFPNIKMINEPLYEDDAAFIPWLVQDEWKDMKTIKSKYIFGHFEIPHFKMNAMVEMPDQGLLNDEHFRDQEYVFTGHFHKRQFRDNIIYIGNPFPHNYADAWDDERGMMLLEWGGEPQFINWPNGPRYRVIRMSHLLTDPNQFINDQTYARVMLDVDLDYEEANFIKETLIEGLNAREIALIPERNEDDEHEQESEEDTSFETIDQIVHKQLRSIESNSYDSETLISIYNSL